MTLKVIKNYNYYKSNFLRQYFGRCFQCRIFVAYSLLRPVLPPLQNYSSRPKNGSRQVICCDIVLTLRQSMYMLLFCLSLSQLFIFILFSVSINFVSIKRPHQDRNKKTKLNTKKKKKIPLIQESKSSVQRSNIYLSSYKVQFLLRKKYYCKNY